jgi:hypothetical protein
VSGELVDRRAVRFYGGALANRAEPVVSLYVPPRDTLDPRYERCTRHHTACDCREAVWAEHLAELIADTRDLQRACDQLLAGHNTYGEVFLDDGRHVVGTPCMCTGCQIARAVHIYPRNHA